MSSVTWFNSGDSVQDLVLMSSSFDFTVALWKANKDGAWVIESTLGALIGNKHAYFGAVFLQG